MLRKLLLTLLCLIHVPAWGMIKTIDSLEELSLLVEQHDERSLFVFDIDQVLITEADQIAWPCNALHFERLWDETFGELSASERRHYLSLFFTQGTMRTVENGTADFLRRIQQRGIPTLALTARRSGPYGSIENQEEQLLEELSSVGIDFSRSFPDALPATFDGFGEKHPIYFSGLAMADHANKGEVLQAVLAHLSFTPQRIVFIDDLRDNLLDVGHALHELGIQATLYHYLGAYRLEEEIDVAKEKGKFLGLRDTGTWR